MRAAYPFDQGSLEGWRFPLLLLFQCSERISHDVAFIQVATSPYFGAHVSFQFLGLHDFHLHKLSGTERSTDAGAPALTLSSEFILK